MTKNKNEDLSFFDEQYFKNIESNSKGDYNKEHNLEKDIKSEEISIASENSNYIDNLVFKQQINSKENEKSPNNLEKNKIEKYVKVEDILREEELNYFDELVFQPDSPHNELNDKSIGTIERKEFNNKKRNKEIPLVTSRNLNKEDRLKQSAKTFSLNKSDQEELLMSDHKSFLKEIPNWFKMVIITLHRFLLSMNDNFMFLYFLKTQDEGAHILKKNICFFNEEGNIT